MKGGTIASTSDVGVIPSSWTIQGTCDFNSDGHTDILWRNTTTGDVVVWFMNGGAIALLGRLWGNPGVVDHPAVTRPV